MDASTLNVPSYDSRVEFTDDEGENDSETNSDDSSCALTVYDGYLSLFIFLSSESLSIFSMVSMTSKTRKGSTPQA